MRITTTDPMTLNDVTDLDNAPFIIEGERERGINIYFESEQNRDDYLAMESHGAGDLSGLRDQQDGILYYYRGPKLPHGLLHSSTRA